jgi:FMN phosphatase YigB (HAD superfamily)
MSQVIVFDMDGVLADFRQGFKDMYERVHGKAFPHNLETARWDDFLDDETWAHVRGSLSFWRDLPALMTEVDAKRIAALQRQERLTYFVTARPGRSVVYQTKAWLFSRGIMDANVIISDKKGAAAEAVGASHLIDDKVGNCLYVAYHCPKVKVFIRNQPHNVFDHNVAGRRVVRVPTVTEFLDALAH